MKLKFGDLLIINASLGSVFAKEAFKYEGNLED